MTFRYFPNTVLVYTSDCHLLVMYFQDKNTLIFRQMKSIEDYQLICIDELHSFLYNIRLQTHTTTQHYCTVASFYSRAHCRSSGTQALEFNL